MLSSTFLAGSPLLSAEKPRAQRSTLRVQTTAALRSIGELLPPRSRLVR